MTTTPSSAPSASAPASAIIDAKYDPKDLHKAEGVYSTPISSLLRLHEWNRYIHSIHSLSYPLEFVIFLFGYAFNPVSIPFWMIVATMTGACPKTMIFPTNTIISSNGADIRDDDDNEQQQLILQMIQEYHNNSNDQDNNNNKNWMATMMVMIFPPTFYFVTVLITLLGTEICKFSFKATRPENILSKDFRSSKIRRFKQLVASLKSKHSFPSGDSAQAANAVLFWFYYISPFLLLKWQQLQQQQSSSSSFLSLGHVFAFGFFYPGVAFARIFYHCHWIEDCLAGAVLAFLLHKTIIPTASYFVWQGVEQYIQHHVI